MRDSRHAGGDAAMADDDIFDLSEALSMLAEELTKGIREYALGVGWPTHIAESLVVYSTPDGQMQVGSQYGQAALDDLEYGRPGQPPKSVIGNYLNNPETLRKAEDTVSRRIADHLAEHAESAMVGT